MPKMTRKMIWLGVPYLKTKPVVYMYVNIASH